MIRVISNISFIPVTAIISISISAQIISDHIRLNFNMRKGEGKLEYQEFISAVRDRFLEKLGREAVVRVGTVEKINGIILDSVSVMENGVNISPALYMNSFYEEYEDGESFDAVFERIWDIYRRYRKSSCADVSFLYDYSKVRGRIIRRVVCTEKNSHLLESVPHREFLDLSLIYYYFTECREYGSAAVLIKNDLMRMWHVTPEELDAQSVLNMKELLPWEFISMKQLIEGFTEAEDDDFVPLYVLSNVRRCFGAAWMADQEVLRSIADIIRKDYYILPSSVHECLILPAHADADAQSLRDMVYEINRSQVEPEEVLSDNVYYYSIKDGALGIA